MLIFENAKASFNSACGTTVRDNDEVKFYREFAKMIPDNIDVDSLVLALKIAFQDYLRSGIDTMGYIALVPHFVRLFVSREFSHEFRKKYNAEVLGLVQAELPDVDFGYSEVKPDVIDISDKDRNEVLAALYNASTPVGIGFAQYNPEPWTKEIAKLYFDKFGQPDVNGVVFFKWILGRPLNCKFMKNLVYVEGYNNDNEWGLAQKVIATCPNLSEQSKSLKR